MNTREWSIEGDNKRVRETKERREPRGVKPFSSGVAIPDIRRYPSRGLGLMTSLGVCVKDIKNKVDFSVSQKEKPQK